MSTLFRNAIMVQSPPYKQVIVTFDLHLILNLIKITQVQAGDSTLTSCIIVEVLYPQGYYCL